MAITLVYSSQQGLLPSIGLQVHLTRGGGAKTWALFRGSVLFWDTGTVASRFLPLPSVWLPACVVSRHKMGATLSNDLRGQIRK